MRPGAEGTNGNDYYGFKGAFDKTGQFIFESQDERDRWQIQRYGHVRNGYRVEGEPQDGRPLLYYTEPFWESEDQRLTYEHAAESRPQREGEGWFAHALRLAAIAEGRMLRMPSMPRKRRMTQDEHHERVNELQAQAQELLKGEPGEFVVQATPKRKAALLAAIGYEPPKDTEEVGA
jgi:hypothetical protein